MQNMPDTKRRDLHEARTWAFNQTRFINLIGTVVQE
jgi:hypothetical protein